MAAFSAIVGSLVADVITPVIGAVFGKPDFSSIALGPVLTQAPTPLDADRADLRSTDRGAGCPPD